MGSVIIMSARGVRGAGVVLVVIVLGACSAGAPGDPASPPATRAAGQTPEPNLPGPLEAYLGLGVVAETSGELLAGFAQREDAIGACMTEQGFEYVPWVAEVDSLEFGDGPARGTREFAELYGYGVWEGPEGEPGQYTFSADDSANRAYRDSLSSAAQQAYDEALQGAMTVEGNVTTFDGSGCASAPDVGTGAQAAWLFGVAQEATDYLNALGEDPRFTEVDAAWATCMADAGYTDDTPLAAYFRVIDETSRPRLTGPRRRTPRRCLHRSADSRSRTSTARRPPTGQRGTGRSRSSSSRSTSMPIAPSSTPSPRRASMPMSRTSGPA